MFPHSGELFVSFNCDLSVSMCAWGDLDRYISIHFFYSLYDHYYYYYYYYFTCGRCFSSFSKPSIDQQVHVCLF